MSEKFLSYDWNKDQRWVEMEKTFEYPVEFTEEQRKKWLLKKKKTYYKAFIDLEFDFNSIPDNISAGSSASSSSKPSASSPSSSYSSSSTSSSSTSRASSSPSSSASSSGSSSSALGPMEPYFLAGHMFFLICSIVWLLPLEISSACYSYACFIVIAINSASLWRRHGRPRWDKEYARVCLTDERTMHLFHALLLLGARPMVLMLVPHAIRSVIFVARYLPSRLQQMAPSLAQTLAPHLQQVRANEAQLLLQGAVLDVYVFGMLIFFLLSGQAALLSVVMYFQWLRAKYFISQNCKAAFSQIRMSTDGVFHHANCPGVVSSLYDKLIGMLSSMGEMPSQEQVRAAQQGGVGGLTSGCNIM